MSTSTRVIVSLDSSVTSALQPGARGSRQCWCTGQILTLLGHYGWILPLEDIEGNAAKKNGGKIYLDKKDISGGAEFAEGDIVGFYLYLDDMGLGAEAARCLKQASTTSFNAGAPEFVPLASTDANPTASFNAAAPEFVPSIAPAASPAPSLWQKKESKTYKGKFYYVHSETGKTSWTMPEDSPKATVEDGPKATVDVGNVACLQSELLAYLSDESDDESGDDTDESDCHEYPSFAPGKAASQRSLSPVASTCAGLSSDSEVDDAVARKRGWETLPEACLCHKFSPPPGLSLPSCPNKLALGVLVRAGLSTGQEQQLPQQLWPELQKCIPKRRRANVTAIRAPPARA